MWAALQLRASATTQRVLQRASDRQSHRAWSAAPGERASQPRGGVRGEGSALEAPAAAARRGRFDSAGELDAWLAAHGVPTGQFGMGQAKTVEELHDEVQRGESALRLAAGAPVREVSVLNLLLERGRGGQVLVEASQTRPDGRVRVRGLLPLSEKMVAGEGWREAAVRGVGEELGSVLAAGWEAQLALFEDSLEVVRTELTSPSYPGLRTVYTLHRVRGRLPCLPEGPFETREARPGGQLVTRWEWRARPAEGGGAAEAGSGTGNQA
ncbi:hypothetical protein Rsub_02973 [Raphidocelis subcapitata]|uniref:Nudix hydrolase domain-containing protein n=1 Tax=Raphidocelis subcapitata TaxID=307507 RepID=A0A2V0NW71_9CHLO|nr:hypothetical protein Rsub_02973 [Raphidocelis subcapitata]|eukprot:GBF89803.1 hypothetical protein Rsub_02973 [Raphidocelis subcapitata]